MKKLFITGGCGFIGSNFIISEIKKGDRTILNYDLLTYSGNKDNLKAISKNEDYSFIEGDICNYDALFNAISNFKPDYIIHFAAESHVDRSIDNPYAFLKTNIMGVFNILESLRSFSKINKKIIKLVHVSTDEVYGDIPKHKKVNEDYNYNPSSPYSASKAAADQLLKAYFRTYSSKIIIANACNNYGPRQLPEKFIPKIIFNILKNKSIPLYGKGKNVREWIYVRDNCEALLKIFLKGKIGKNYNIGTGKRLKNLEIVKNIFNIAKKNKIKFSNKNNVKYVKDRPGHDERYAVNSSRIRKELKWRQKTSLTEGLNKTFKWYMNNKKFFKLISKKNINRRFGLKI